MLLISGQVSAFQICQGTGGVFVPAKRNPRVDCKQGFQGENRGRDQEVF
jgi:hypothetical protein